MDGQNRLLDNDFLWRENGRLREENRRLAGKVAAGDRKAAVDAGRIEELELRAAALEESNRQLLRRAEELREKLESAAKPIPSFVKPNVPEKIRGKPGRKKGHVAALRPVPPIDVHQPVGLPVDGVGKCCCPDCKTQLSDVQQHERIVEDMVPAKIITTCYHTTSGYCPQCRKRVESRAADQPPAAEIPHGQLGLNALATAAVLRLAYRLPLRKISELYAALPKLRCCAGAIAKQIKRLGRWLKGQYERLKLVLRAAGVVHADESGWRTNGKNGYIWTLCDPSHTLYHVDSSRGGKVVQGLLGEGFGAEGKSTLVSDFYSAYGRIKGRQQKCLLHLLRELKETVNRRGELRRHAFFVRCRRLVKDMLKLKEQREALKEEVYLRRVKRLEDRLGELGDATWNDGDADRLAGRLRKHRNQLTVFLRHVEVDGTNNAAERALRPMVVMRKISGGSRGEEAARATAILASVIRTAQQQGRDLVETIKTLLRAAWDGKDIGLLTDGS